ncbi:MAG: hypothetical protein ABSC57_07320, partial [Syntrophales bacterium]
QRHIRRGVRELGKRHGVVVVAHPAAVEKAEQFQLAVELDVKNYPCPAGGCLLTELSFVSKVKDVFAHNDLLNLRDFRLLKLGRHFRASTRTKFIVGRDEAENDLLEKAVAPGEASVRWLEGGSPLGVLLGHVDDALLETAAKIVLRYTKAEMGRECVVMVTIDGNERLMRVTNEFDEQKIEEFRI